MIDDIVTLFHAPQTRSSGTLTLLEELGGPYDLHILNAKAGQHRQPEYLAVNPLGKVPAIRHRGVVITEQIAIAIYLGDLFPQAGLTPSLGDLRRGPYLRWLVYYAACYEPGLVDQFMKREPAPIATSPYGDFEGMLANVVCQIEKQPYLLGDTPTVADILWGNAFRWGVRFKLVPETKAVADYISRIVTRPAALKAASIDEALAAEHQEALEAAGA